jgi:hypothetical protein
VQQRSHSKLNSFEDRIVAEKARVEEQLAGVSRGPQRDTLVKRIRQLDTASRINAWLISPGLQPPE